MAQNKVAALEGRERADYPRLQIPESRWGDTWEVLKSSFGKFVFINLLVIVFLTPLIGVLFTRMYYIAGQGLLYPFSANVGIGYPANPGTVGMAESIHLKADLMFFALVIAAGIIGAAGIAGGAYSAKKLVNTRGEFTFKGFFRGIKVGFLNTAFAVTLFTVVLFGCVVLCDLCDLSVAKGAAPGGPVTAKVFLIIFTVLVGIYSLWLMAVGVSYKVNLWQQIKCSFTLMIATPVHTVFFAVLAALPVFLFAWFWTLGGIIWQLLSYIILLLLGFGCALLIWMSFTQWVFDLFIAPDVKAKAAESKKPKTAKELEAEKAEEEKQVAMQLLAAGKSELIGRPILPIEEQPFEPIPAAFSREDVKRAAADREALAARIADYAEAHKNEPKYLEYEKLFADREKVLQDEGKGKKGKKKKTISADNLLK